MRASRRQHRPQPTLAPDEILRRGLGRLGWHVDAMPRTCSAASRGRLRLLRYGCPLGAKQSTPRTWLEDAAAAGARIVVGARARRVYVGRGRGRVDAGPVQVRSRAVVVAAGAIETPALLLRSGLSNPNRRPLAAAPSGDGRLRPLRGGRAALGGRCRRSTPTAAPPPRRRVRGQVRDGSRPSRAAELGAAVGGAAASARLMSSLPRLSLVAVIPRDSGAGRVRIGRDGEAIATYRLGPDDADSRPASTVPAGSWPPPAPARSSPRTRGCSAGTAVSPTRSASAPAAAPLLLPPHGLGPDGRVAEARRRRPAGETWECATSSSRTARLSDRVRREPDGHDRGDRAPERAPARGQLGPARSATAPRRRGTGRAPRRAASGSRGSVGRPGARSTRRAELARGLALELEPERSLDHVDPRFHRAPLRIDGLVVLPDPPRLRVAPSWTTPTEPCGVSRSSSARARGLHPAVSSAGRRRRRPSRRSRSSVPRAAP